MAEADLSIEQHDKLHGVHEIRIPLPFGDVIGKWWGPRDIRPIVCLHGWMDNAGSFDRLIPLLPRHISFLAIDLPGQGRSAHLPQGVAYHTMNVLYLLHHMMARYGWRKVALLSHSIGAVISYVYAGLFPDKIDFLISLDIFKPFILDPDMTLFLLSDSIPKFVESDQMLGTTEGPVYDYDRMVNYMHMGFQESISREACPFLLHRNIEPCHEQPGRYRYRWDIRVKHNYGLVWSHELNLEVARRIRCPFLFVKTTETPIFEDVAYHNETIDVLRKLNPDFVERSVEGKHHVHLSHPDRVAPAVNEFLARYWTEDRSCTSKL